MTNNQKQKITYKIVEGKLCIEHIILLQRLTFRKTGKNNEKTTIYYSYFIKLPLQIYNLISPENDLLYLKKTGKKITIMKNPSSDAKKVKIQIDNNHISQDKDHNRYKISIPKKFINEANYTKGKSYIKCTITSNKKNGYTIKLEQH